MEGLADYGIAAMAIFAMIVLIRFLEARIQKKNGDKRVVVECPNKIDGLAVTLKSIDGFMKTIAASTSECRSGVGELVKDHAPGSDGVQSWKMPARTLEIWEKITTQQQQMLAMNSRIVAAVERTADTQQEIKVILIRNGGAK